MENTGMQRFAIAISFAILALPGCGGGLAPNSNLEVAEQSLQTSLEAWKSGKSPTDLEKGKPSIIVNDDDWRAGKRLLEFTMEKGALSGRQIRCKVHIKLEDKNGDTMERDAVYIIDTTPRIVIVRDSFAS
jgi:hypothetical protein